jgi:hypothetical protein
MKKVTKHINYILCGVFIWVGFYVESLLKGTWAQLPWVITVIIIAFIFLYKGAIKWTYVWLESQAENKDKENRKCQENTQKMK